MMLPSINMMSATADSTAVKSDELQMSTTSISDTTPTEIEGTPSDTIPALSKRELRRQRVANRNLHYNILGGPSYTPDFGLLVGGSALMTFRMNPSDTTQRRSVVPMAIALMFKGGLNLMTKPQFFFKGDRFRIFGTFSYKNTIENFYGIGYSTNKDYERGEDTSEYRYSGIQVNPWFLFRLGESNFFAGPQVDLNYDKITKPAAGMVNEPSYIAAGGTEHGYKNFSSGLGFLLTYDTRDIPANAYNGTYLDFRGMMYNKTFGSDNNFYRLEIDYRQYKTVGRRKVIAWTVQSKNAFGDVPLTKYVLSGTPLRSSRLLHGTVSRQVLACHDGRIPPDDKYGQKHLDKKDVKSYRICSLGRMRFHGTHSGQDRRCASQPRIGITYRSSTPYECTP